MAAKVNTNFRIGLKSLKCKARTALILCGVEVFLDISLVGGSKVSPIFR